MALNPGGFADPGLAMKGEIMAETETTTEEVKTEGEGQQTEGQTEGQQTEAEAKAAGEAAGEPKTVPFDRFQEMVDKVKQLEEQALVVQQQQALAKANPVQGQQVQQPQFDIYKEVGLDADDPEDIPNQGQLKKIFDHYGTVFSRQLADIDFRQTHPDYAQIVGTFDEIASGKYAAPLAEAIKKNPALLHDIRLSPNPKVAAYNIAKLQLKKPEGKTVTTDEAKVVIDEAIKNAERVKSSANAKGGEALSEEGRYAKMPDPEFVKLALSHGAQL